MEVHMDSFKMKAMRDELVKIAGESRIGRRPVSADRLLERENEQQAPRHLFTGESVDPAAFKADVEKLSAVGKYLASGGIGAAGALGLRRANEDRKLGKAVRKQQGQGF